MNQRRDSDLSHSLLLWERDWSLSAKPACPVPWHLPISQAQSHWASLESFVFLSRKYHKAIVQWGCWHAWEKCWWIALLCNLHEGVGKTNDISRQQTQSKESSVADQLWQGWGQHGCLERLCWCCCSQVLADLDQCTWCRHRDECFEGRWETSWVWSRRCVRFP